MRKWILKDNAFKLVATNREYVIVEVKRGHLEVKENEINYKNEFSFTLYFNNKERTFNKSMARSFKCNSMQIWLDINWFMNSPEVVFELESFLGTEGICIDETIKERYKLNAAFLIYGSEYDMMLREIDRALDNGDFEALKQLSEMVAEIDELQRA